MIFYELHNLIRSIIHLRSPWLLYFADCVVLLFYGGNRCVNVIIIIFHGGNTFSSFFNTVNFWLSRFFFFINTLSLVVLPVFSNSGPIKVGDISYSLLTPESYQDSNRAEKIQSTPQRIPSTLYQKRQSSRNSLHARIYWLLYRVILVTCVPVNLDCYKIYLHNNPLTINRQPVFQCC